MPGGRVLLICVRSLIVAALAAPFWFWKGGVLELEVLQFIRQYLDGRTVLAKVFDPYKNDFNTYQARELSYFIDYVDARVFERLMHWDVISFIPLSAIVASILTVAVFSWGSRRYRAVPAITGALLLLLYLTNYIHLVTMGMFYRSAKPLLTPIVMAATFFLAAVLAGQTKRRAALVVFALFSLMSLFDRQGFFYAAAGFALLVGSALVNRGQWRLVAAGGAAIACMVFYDLWLGPQIVNAINNYVPSLAYQTLPADQLTRSVTPYARAAELLGESATVLFGSFSPWIAGAAVAALVTAAVLKTGPETRSRLLLVASVAFILGTSVVMFALMVVRHPPIYEWIDHRYWYYPLPFQALLISLTVILLDRIMHRWTGWRPVLLNAAIAVAIVGNVAHWGMYRDRMLTSRWFSRVYPQTAILQSSIDAGRPDPRLIRQYREFFDLCARLSPGLESRVKQ